MSKCSVGHAGTLCSASSLLCLVVVWSSAAVGEHHVQVRKGCKWKDYKQWCTFGRKLSIVATQDTIWRKTKKKRNKQTFFLEWAEKERKRGGRKPLRRTPTPAQRSPSFQKVKEYSRSSHSSEVIKPLIFIIDMVEPSDQNHERYVDTAADGNINDIQTVKVKSSHHTYKPGLVCFWCVAESCWETMEKRILPHKQTLFPTDLLQHLENKPLEKLAGY